MDGAPLNSALRTNSDTAHTFFGKRPAKPWAKTLDDAIEKAPRTPDNMIVLRGIDERGANKLGLLRQVEGRMQIGPTATRGSIIEDAGYMSTTGDSSVMKAFGGTKARLEIEVPAGQRGIFISNVRDRRGRALVSGNIEAESEFLLPRGTRLEILGSKIEKGQLVVRARTLQTGEGASVQFTITQPMIDEATQLLNQYGKEIGPFIKEAFGEKAATDPKALAQAVARVFHEPEQLAKLHSYAKETVAYIMNAQGI
jgi:hypothetical protein